MFGWFYRLGVSVRELGERLRFSPLVRAGLRICDIALQSRR
jgi:hypothetical protein